MTAPTLADRYGAPDANGMVRVGPRGDEVCAACAHWTRRSRLLAAMKKCACCANHIP